jgi:hypothetical protein
VRIRQAKRFHLIVCLSDASVAEKKAAFFHCFNHFNEAGGARTPHIPNSRCEPLETPSVA